MNLESLVLSRDPQLIRIFRQILEKLSIDMEVCQGAQSGNEILGSEKFDAVVVDCDDLQGGLEVLEALRKNSSNKSSVAFAVLNGVTSTQKAFELGASFVMQKPISTLNTMRCFTAALGLMERERRRYFRYPVMAETVLSFSKGQEVKAVATNLSEAGMAVRINGAMPKGVLSKVAVTLPETNYKMEAKVELAWADARGRAGLKLVEMSRESRETYDRWLEDQLKKLEQPKKGHSALSASAN